MIGKLVSAHLINFKNEVFPSCHGSVAGVDSPIMKRIFTVLLASLVFVSCAPSTPQTRIAKNPQQFAALSKKDQSYVLQGQLTRGMTRDAVALAWGYPSQRFEGFKESKKMERWDYIGTRPVYVTNYYGGYGYGPYGRHGYTGFGFGPDIAYVPDRYASVWFANDRVDAWERGR